VPRPRTHAVAARGLDTPLSEAVPSRLGCGEDRPALRCEAAAFEGLWRRSGTAPQHLESSRTQPRKGARTEGVSPEGRCRDPLLILGDLTIQSCRGRTRTGEQEDGVMPSQKTAVIEHLFHERYDAATGVMANPEVSMDEVVAAIRDLGANLQTNNPANFFKDIVRSPRRNENFPASVVAAGWTAEQSIGEGMSFRFVPLPAGQITAFTDFAPTPESLADPSPLQSLSLSLASRRLGRSDEAWLTQAASRLLLVHTHLALRSQINVLTVDLLQTNVKLGSAEIDALFLAIVDEGTEAEALVPVEMKSRTEMLEPEQILRGAQAVKAAGAAALANDEVLVIPMGVKAYGDGVLWVVEFGTTFPPLTTASEATYRFVPAVPGI
jgi:hypothetical protein